MNFFKGNNATGTAILSTVTGPDGKYFFDLEEYTSGDYTLKFTKDNYKDAALNVTVDGEVKDLKIYLVSIQGISGTVYTSPDMEPLSDVTVQLWKGTNTEGTPLKTSTTDSSGKYTFELTESGAGSYTIVLTKSGYKKATYTVSVSAGATRLHNAYLEKEKFEEVPIDEAHFPDKGFRIYVSDNFDIYPRDGVLSEEEISEATSVYLYKYDTDRILPHDPPALSQKKYGTVYSLKGIEYLPALQSLSCIFHEITTVDISQNHELKSLEIIGNKLTSIDVSKNQALKELSVSQNKLTDIDVSKNTALRSLYCGENPLKKLDVSKNTLLEALQCISSQLSDLDISNNLALRSLFCSNNQLTILDLTKHTALEYLECYGNQLTFLDLSKNTSLRTVYCGGNKLTSLNVSKNTALIEIECSGNQLTTLDLSNNTALDKIYCSDNLLTALTLGNNTSLSELHCENNLLSNLDVSKNTSLAYLYCSDNKLTALNLLNNKNLSSLECQNNNITLLDLSNCPNIKNRNYVTCDKGVTIILSNGKTIVISSAPSTGNGASEENGNEIIVAKLTAFKATHTGEYVFNVSFDRTVSKDSTLILKNSSENLSGVFIDDNGEEISMPLTKSLDHVRVSANFEALKNYSPVIAATSEEISNNNAGGCNSIRNEELGIRNVLILLMFALGLSIRLKKK